MGKIEREGRLRGNGEGREGRGGMGKIEREGRLRGE